MKITDIFQAINIFHVIGRKLKELFTKGSTTLTNQDVCGHMERKFRKNGDIVCPKCKVKLGRWK